jgi:hypothetical protein
MEAKTPLDVAEEVPSCEFKLLADREVVARSRPRGCRRRRSASAACCHSNKWGRPGSATRLGGCSVPTMSGCCGLPMVLQLGANCRAVHHPAEDDRGKGCCRPTCHSVSRDTRRQPQLHWQSRYQPPATARLTALVLRREAQQAACQHARRKAHRRCPLRCDHGNALLVSFNINAPWMAWRDWFAAAMRRWSCCLGIGPSVRGARVAASGIARFRP